MSLSRPMQQRQNVAAQSRKDTAACVSLSQSQPVKEQGTLKSAEIPRNAKPQRPGPVEDPSRSAHQRRPVDEPYLDNPRTGVNTSSEEFSRKVSAHPSKTPHKHSKARRRHLTISAEPEETSTPQRSSHNHDTRGAPQKTNDTRRWIKARERIRPRSGPPCGGFRSDGASSRPRPEGLGAEKVAGAGEWRPREVCGAPKAGYIIDSPRDASGIDRTRIGRANGFD